MARPPIDLHQMVCEILQHSTELHPHADRPILHFERSTNSAIGMLEYIVQHIDTTRVNASVYERRLGQVRRMILAELIESFERFLKELAAVCIDFLAPYTTDDRFDDFLPRRGGTIAAFVNATSIGRALCESDTWINNASINSRFASLLKDPTARTGNICSHRRTRHLPPSVNGRPRWRSSGRSATTSRTMSTC